jgi:hypothetical protein
MPAFIQDHQRERENTSQPRLSYNTSSTTSVYNPRFTNLVHSTNPHITNYIEVSSGSLSNIDKFMITDMRWCHYRISMQARCFTTPDLRKGQEHRRNLVLEQRLLQNLKPNRVSTWMYSVGLIQYNKQDYAIWVVARSTLVSTEKPLNNK